MRAAHVPPSAPSARPGADRIDAWFARRHRLTSGVLVLMLVVLGGFAVWSSQAMSNTAQDAYAASRLADEYASAVTALVTAEALERDYRLEPGPAVLVSYTEAGEDLVDSLDAVERLGGEADRTRIAQVRDVHADYLEAAGRMFAAVDASDEDAALVIGGDEVDPLFASMAGVVFDGAVLHQRHAMAEIDRLQWVETVKGRVTPIAFAVALLLAALLAAATRAARRSLDGERRRAVHTSLHDRLTGLPNRILLAERCTTALSIAASTGEPVGLLLVDLDRFREVNDTFGHHCGDELLTQIGPRLRASLRAEDTVARLGGDEFAVLLPNVCDLATATSIAERLRAELERTFQVDGVALGIEASIGVVLSGLHGADATTLMQRVDIAMYVAKAQNLGVFVYTREVDAYSPTKLALLGDLRRALEMGELVLHYQPQVAIGTGELLGVEALVRWQHPERGLVLPDEFIPMAEHTGVIGPLTTYVLEAALAQARQWIDEQQPLSVSVNLSARNLLDEGLPDQVAGLLAKHGVPADLLQLEVTESAIMSEPERAVRVLTALADLGVRISLDDFGAGYTSMSQLTALPVSELKIDRSFVTSMTQSGSDALIVRSIVDLGHNLGLTIVAEGVESAHALAALTALGCDVAQGYHLARPASAEAFASWRSARHTRPIRPAKLHLKVVPTRAQG